MSMFRLMPWLVCIGLAASGCVPGTKQERAQELSIEALTSNPSAYDGRLVRVRGFLKLQFENTNMFSTELAAQQHDEKQCIGLLILRDAFRRYSTQLNDRVGVVTGSFVASACTPDDICTWYCEGPGILVDSVTPANVANGPTN